jgi:hypothetical protein
VPRFRGSRNRRPPPVNPAGSMSVKARLLALRDDYRRGVEVLPWEDPPGAPPAPILLNHTTVFVSLVERGPITHWGACERMTRGMGAQYWGKTKGGPVAAVAAAIVGAPPAQRVCVVLDSPKLYLDCSQRLWLWLEQKTARGSWADLAEVIQSRNATFVLACNGTSECRDRANELAEKGDTASCQPPSASITKPVLRRR